MNETNQFVGDMGCQGCQTLKNPGFCKSCVLGGLERLKTIVSGFKKKEDFKK